MYTLTYEAKTIPPNFTGKIVYKNGEICYLKNGLWHREDGPAFEDVDGNKYYYLNGKIYSELSFYKELDKRKNSCKDKQSQGLCNKIVEIDGKKYKLVEL